ncbi:MAG: hypothetical protein R6X20_17660 [Phycisphaerae bacterium]
MARLQTLLRYLRSLFLRSSQNAATPTASTPPPSAPPTPAAWQRTGQGVQPIETHYERHFAPGMGLELGNQERAILDGEELVEGRETIHQVLGCGHPVARFDAASEDGQPVQGVGGICPFCQAEQEQLLATGKTTPAQARLASCFCTECARACGNCGIAGCARHLLRVEMPDGTKPVMCPQCRTMAERKAFVRRVFGVVTAPFIEPEDPRVP